MNINELLKEKGMTKYRLSKISGIPHATLNDLCCGKSRIEKCSGETLYKIAKALQIPMEALIEDTMMKKNSPPDIKKLREDSYEYGLPEYLQHDLDAYKEALEHGSNLLDCLWGELYGSINAAEITDEIISHEQADYLRNKYLWR
ncbi:MAG: helix-turn-helix transcriptional regulator [Roseburia sp.]|nr:helix-turn-helix transcriptional regulator [Roseburia sp.]MCM1279230.1 helix-turn-helix transcriptional regulator [Robinsoniella sp.]